ncbi:glycine--tRNA ligase subunit beta [Brevundimonas staleyi]|uniref:Glycine--tRNA ligase beta subunit n=1 Tax=Brevundimonas staleyi TaxID=74326 RepID=A0ABW0FWH3_9CAUL
MPQLLLELFSEEIPARMQAGAARDLERMASERLKAAGLTWDALTTYAGPRRLTLVIDGLPTATPDRSEELKGPRANAPEQALEGFLRKTGLTRDQLTERDGVLFAVIDQKGVETTSVIPGMVEGVIRDFPWPKSMRWADATLRWVRPLKRILCLFDGKVVDFAIADGSPDGQIVSGDTTEGHRFMGAKRPLKIRDFADYRKQLEANYVVLDVADRKLKILEAAKAACSAKGLALVDDDGLLDEVAGLAEWPTPILGDMDPQFLDLPPEVVRLSMKVHQKYFAVRDPQTGKLAPNFIVVANVEASDGGVALAAGNSRVLSARLNDARFFWDEDQKVGFDAWLEKLSGVTFHAKLGTMAERVDRIAALAREIAPLVGADADQAEKAARLAKADLASGMVGEFPELQGVMGGYYARAFGLDDAVADAIRDHYKPQGPADTVPTAPLTVAVALADKLDTLVGFFAIDEKPTGSKDPFALRRAALGVIRLILDNEARIGLSSDAVSATLAGLSKIERAVDKLSVDGEVVAFFADRLKVLLRDQGKRHDLVDAVFALGDDDLVRIVRRVEALDAFLATDDGANLLAGYKRASNILKAEEKKGPIPTGAVATGLANQPAAETTLAMAAAAASTAVETALEAEDFAAAMTALAALRAPVDAFFTDVLVNSDVAEERENRLKLLGQVRAVMGQVADFGLVAG